MSGGTEDSQTRVGRENPSDGYSESGELHEPGISMT